MLSAIGGAPTVSAPAAPSRPKFPFFKGRHGFSKLGRAFQELYEYLWVLTGYGQNPQVRITDWRIAEDLGRELRWVQKALKQGQDAGWIDRFFLYGRRDEAGRVIAFTFDFLGPKIKPARKDKPPRKDGASQTRIELTPEQEAAIARLQAQRQAEADAVPEVEEDKSPGWARRAMEAAGFIIGLRKPVDVKPEPKEDVLKRAEDRRRHSQANAEWRSQFLAKLNAPHQVDESDTANDSEPPPGPPESPSAP